MRIETESKESAIEKLRFQRNKKGNPLKVTGSINNGGGILETALEIISRDRKLIIFEGRIGQINLPIRPQKEIDFLEL